MHFRAFWLLLGLLATVCGIIGAVLPLVPTTPFLLVAAYAFARSSPRLHDWLLNHPHLGHFIRNWNEHRSIDPGAKTAAVGMMGGAFALSWVTGISSTLLTIQAVVLGAAALFVLTRPSTPET